jgi:hypothetical protein
VNEKQDDESGRKTREQGVGGRKRKGGKCKNEAEEAVDRWNGRGY